MRTGLQLVEAVPKLATNIGASLQVHVGVAAGPVVVGNLIITGAAREQAVVSETPNLGARRKLVPQAYYRSGVRDWLQRRRDRPGQSRAISTIFQLLPIKERAVSAQKLEIRVSIPAPKTLSPARDDLLALRAVTPETPANLKSEVA